MGSVRKIVGVLTSSRADYGIYKPLLRLLSEDKDLDLRVLVFGTHLSKQYGYTVKHIEEDKFNIFCKINSLPSGDSPEDISLSVSETIRQFTSLWQGNHFDMVICLGDRYEMFAAVASTIPFNIPISHIHGGETTLGSIDNVFRNAITCMASLHFTSTVEYKRRVEEIAGSGSKVYNTGALSIDSIKHTELLSIRDFKKKYSIDLAIPTILVTFHPETVNPDINERYISELLESISEIQHYQFVITMPNSDTSGLMIRDKIVTWGQNRRNVFTVESFGSTGYFSCMKHCRMLLGNTSSGFVEASYFSKPVINLGDRQKGRIITPNILTIPVKREEIINAVKYFDNKPEIKIKSIYGNGDASIKIAGIIQKELSI
jgi:GDP/UDP-N,N'-diacetylbacillosamine 2-epimerase (hydrolysing)